MRTIRELKYIVKIIVAYALFYTGILRILMLVKLRRRAIVLIYHRVLSKQMRARTYSHSGIIVDLETFEKQIRYLKIRFKVITLEEFAEKIENGIGFDQPTCLITFDDGWKDNYLHAYPILKKYNMPAAIFLPANYIDSNKQFWQEKLTGMLIAMHHTGREHSDSRQKYLDVLKKYNLQGIMSVPDQELRSYIAEEVSRKKKMTYKEIEQMITDLSKNADPLGKDYDSGDSIMSWDEIRQMKKNGISFGSHGMNHKIFTKVLQAEVDYEIAESKRVIEKSINEGVSSISYPNGNYSDNIIERVKSSGYRIAFGTEKGFVDVKDNPYALKRVNIHNDVTKNIPMFLSTILGVL